MADNNSPRAVLSLRIDRRFDELVRQAPERFDVEAAVRRQTSDHEGAVARHPRSLDALVELTRAYLDAGRYADVLRAAAAALARVPDSDAFHAAYDDDDTALSRLLGDYARALMATQPWEDARGALEIAAEGLEHGSLNAGSIIQLGDFHARLGRPDEALRVLAQIPEDSRELAPQARMAWHGARLLAAVGKGDQTRVRQSLEYLRAHQREAIGAYQEALIWAGRDEEAERLLIARLNDPLLRREALREVQIYSEPPAPPPVMRERERWRALVSLPAVQRAIARVGRIESVPFPLNE
jgi:tetratricopeptide (TPR) repeat protein